MKTAEDKKELKFERIDRKLLHRIRSTERKLQRAEKKGDLSSKRNYENLLSRLYLKLSRIGRRAAKFHQKHKKV